MAVTKPVQLTIIEDVETAVNSPVSEETVLKIAQNLNMLADLVPVGTVRAYATGQVGVQRPDTSIWQVCDGAEITDPRSPIRTVGVTLSFTPNLTGVYLRTSNSTTDNSLGGSASMDLTHNHTGNTTDTDGFHNGHDGSDAHMRENHHHSIANDLGPTTIDLAHVEVLYFIKIV